MTKRMISKEEIAYQRVYEKVAEALLMRRQANVGFAEYKGVTKEDVDRFLDYAGELLELTHKFHGINDKFDAGDDVASILCRIAHGLLMCPEDVRLMADVLAKTAAVIMGEADEITIVRADKVAGNGKRPSSMMN